MIHKITNSSSCALLLLLLLLPPTEWFLLATAAAAAAAPKAEGTPCPYLQTFIKDGVENHGGEKEGIRRLRSPHSWPDLEEQVSHLQSSPTAGASATITGSTSRYLHGNIEAEITNARSDISSLLTGSMSPKFVRLAFHDCVGGCDGCLNLSNPENFGLDIPIDALAPVVSKFSAGGILTRADIWVLAGMVAAEKTQVWSPKVAFDMRYVGRPVCAENDPKGGPHRHFPSSHFVTAELLNYFAKTFPGFTTRDTVALIGAHTLGVAAKENSGYDGPEGWVINTSRLDNEFYRVLISNGVVDDVWRPEMQENIGTVFPDQIIWRQGESGFFMINSDMALAVDFENNIDPSNGVVSCNLGGESNVCPAASTLSIATEYADSNTAWLNDFHDAFIKMTNSGCEDGSSCLDLFPEPTAEPSPAPSSSPTHSPSSKPSPGPSSSLTYPPSSKPSPRPSAFPSPSPSSSPSSKPSCEASSDPSAQPSSAPSKLPSSSLSIVPATEFRAEPSSFPSCVPSAAPSGEPGTEPSAGPSSAPIAEPTSDSIPARTQAPAPSPSTNAEETCQFSFLRIFQWFLCLWRNRFA